MWEYQKEEVSFDGPQILFFHPKGNSNIYGQPGISRTKTGKQTELGLHLTFIMLLPNLYYHWSFLALQDNI